MHSLHILSFLSKSGLVDLDEIRRYFIMLLCDKFQMQKTPISSRLIITERHYGDPLSPFAYESELFVSNAEYSDTGQFTCSYVVNDTQTILPSSTHANVYIYVYGELRIYSLCSVNSFLSQ